MAATVLMWHTQSSSPVAIWWLSGRPVATGNKAQQSGGFHSLDWWCQAMMHGVAMWELHLWCSQASKGVICQNRMSSFKCRQPWRPGDETQALLPSIS